VSINSLSQAESYAAALLETTQLIRLLDRLYAHAVPFSLSTLPDAYGSVVRPLVASEKLRARFVNIRFIIVLRNFFCSPQVILFEQITAFLTDYWSTLQSHTIRLSILAQWKPWRN
jgi:hypothetical protein